MCYMEEMRNMEMAENTSVYIHNIQRTIGLVGGASGYNITLHKNLKGHTHSYNSNSFFVGRTKYSYISFCKVRVWCFVC